MSNITFKTKVLGIGGWKVIRLDSESSRKLTSRGLVMVSGSINGTEMETTLEPDGKGSHWFQLPDSVKAKSGDELLVTLSQTDRWSEPEVPTDLKKVIDSNSKARETWLDITPLARWEWIRWVRSTKNIETRNRRVKVALSKLQSGDRRPCCFNSNQCTVPEISNGGVLIDNS